MNRPPTLFLLLLLALLPTASSAAVEVEVHFYGSVDFSQFTTYAWKEGNPAPNFQVEEAIHGTVDKLLADRGLQKVEGKADCYVISRTVVDRVFPAGVLLLEVFQGSTGNIAWRGMATAVVTSDDPKKRQKIAVKAVKEMFKKFPETGR